MLPSSGSWVGGAASTEAQPQLHPAGDKTSHGHRDGAGVGGIHQSLNVDSSVYKQSVDHMRHVYGAGVSLSSGCNMWFQQNLNRKWQGQRPGVERGASTPVSCIWAHVEQMLLIL